MVDLREENTALKFNIEHLATINQTDLDAQKQNYKNIEKQLNEQTTKTAAKDKWIKELESLIKSMEASGLKKGEWTELNQ